MSSENPLLDFARKYVALVYRKEALKEELDAVQSDLTAMDPELVERFLTEELDRLTVDGKTLSVKETLDLHIKEVDNTAIKRALEKEEERLRDEKDNSEFQFVNLYYPPTLARKKFEAYLRELYKSKEGVPETLSGVFEIKPRHTMSVRKGTTK